MGVQYQGVRHVKADAVLYGTCRAVFAGGVSRYYLVGLSVTNRELLELAAKAAGIELNFPQDYGGADFLSPTNVDGWKIWNPLTDDGDALRLAAALSLCVFVNGMFAQADCKHCPGGDIGYFEENTARNGGCIYAATRRAIVRAAAEIGKAMQ